MPRPARDPFDVGAAVLHAFDTGTQITRYLVAHVDDAAWRAPPPGGKGRTVAAIVAHVHAVRGMWLKGAGGATPAPIDPATATRAAAVEALGVSHAALRAVVAAALAGDGRVAGFTPEVVGFVGYFVAHEAHHRGQIAMLARQVGHPLPKAVGFGMWEWGKRGSEVDLPGPA